MRRWRGQVENLLGKGCQADGDLLVQARTSVPLRFTFFFCFLLSSFVFSLAWISLPSRYTLPPVW
jgi:hypothetical protein